MVVKTVAGPEAQSPPANTPSLEVAPVDSPEFEVTVPYVHDIVFMNGAVKARKEELHAGEFCVLYPQDAHKPCTHLDGPHKVKKVVIKLPVE